MKFLCILILTLILALLISQIANAQIRSFPQNSGWIAIYPGEVLNDTTHNFMNCAFYRVTPINSVVTINGVDHAIIPKNSDNAVMSSYILPSGSVAYFKNVYGSCNVSDKNEWFIYTQMYQVFLPVLRGNYNVK